MSKDSWQRTKHDRNEARKQLSLVLKEKGPVRLSSHFRQRAQERSFSIVDAMNILERGKILTGPELVSGTWRYRIETQKMAVIFAFAEDGKAITLITAMWKEGGRSL